MFLFFLVFFGLQIFVLFCCAAAGNDAASQELSDQEQLQFIAEWKKQHQKKDVCRRTSFLLCNSILHSYDDTHQSAFAVIYDLLHSILKLHLTFFADHGQLVPDSVFHQLLDGFSENIGLPDTFPSLRAFSDILYQVLRLLFCTNDRSDLRFDSRPDHMNGRTF